MITKASELASDEMVEGYRDGYVDDRDDLPADSNRSEPYAHGWRNGRDDRKGMPRSGAETLRNDAAAAVQAFADRY